MNFKQSAIVLTVVISAGCIARADTPTTDPVGDAALAQRAAQIAQTNLATRTVNNITLREAALLLEAAAKLDPTDGRYPHLRSEACLSLHDTEGALDALKQCAALDGSDQGAQVQMIDLYSATDPQVSESADAKIRYYQDLVGLDKVAPEVRAHVGVKLAMLFLDRGQDDQAKDALDNALKLNPLDPDAVEMKERMTRKGLARDHIAALMAMLRCNPAQPAVESELAKELAQEGLTNESATWYNNSINVGGRLGVPTDPGIFCSYVEELMIGGQEKGVDVALDSLLKSDPTNNEALYLKIVLARKGTDKDAIGKAVDDARDGFLERLYTAYRAAMKTDPPSTRPSGELLERTGDVVAEAKQVKQSGNEAVIAQFASALTDLAWLEAYFAQTPGPVAQLTAALHEVVPDDDVRFERLDGWALIAAGKPDEAKVKLSAVAERDPLSAMGLVHIASKDASKEDDVKSSAQALLDDNRGGLLAIMLLDGLHDTGAAVQVSSEGNDIKGDLDKFPKGWFTILDAPENFYVVTCQASKISFGFDEPMLAAVTVINTSPFDIAVGAKGSLKPDLWFDVNIRGPQTPLNIAGVAYDRLNRRLVLHKGENFTQVLRLDQPKLSALQQNPVAAFTLLFSLVTNPITGPSGGIAPGPGGQRVQLRKQIERAANPINALRLKSIEANLSNQRTDLRMSTMSLVTAYAQLLAKSQDEKTQAQAKAFADAIAQLAADPSQPVQTWSRMLQISLEPPENRSATLKAMVESSYWPQRLLGAAEALGLGNDGKTLIQSLADDEEPIVKKFAAAALDDLAHPTTQSTTAPSTTAPSETPGTPSAPTSAPALDLKL
jgi:tetratricopeptide (TPR) repeat protein